MTEPTQAKTNPILNGIRDTTRIATLGFIMWIVNTLYQVDRTVANYSWRLERLETRLDSVDRRLMRADPQPKLE